MDSGDVQADRDALAAKVLTMLQAAGYTGVKTRLPGFEPPEAVRWRAGDAGHVPHFTAEKSGHSYIFEVATRADLAKLSTEERWRLFSYHAEEAGATFIIVVDRSDKPQAEAELRRLRITAKIMGSARA